MKKRSTKTSYLIAFWFLLLTTNMLQAQIHLVGKVYVNLESGLFKCKLEVQNLPDVEDYEIVLNKGMNIKYFKGQDGGLIRYKGYYEGKTLGEGICYHFVDRKGKSELPNSFTVEYLGAFPVYDGDYNLFDFKGYIANNGQTLRAAEQTKWYPTLYDRKSDVLHVKCTYDLAIEIVGGNSIYVNGANPRHVSKGRFVSTKPVAPLLFLGDFLIVENKGNYILNDTVSSESAVRIGENLARIKNVLFDIFGQDFSDPVTLISHKAVNKRRPGSSWGFNTYPTFAFTGISFAQMVDTSGNISQNNYRFFGHELSHNYFGFNVNSGILKWFWLESIPEYCSFRVDLKLNGEASHKERLMQRLKNIKSQNFVSLDRIRKSDEIDEKYRYNLGPLLLKCMEIEFGVEAMDEILKKLYEKSLQRQLQLADLKSFAVESGIKKTAYNDFYSKYVSSPNFVKNIKAKINEICR